MRKTARRARRSPASSGIRTLIATTANAARDGWRTIQRIDIRIRAGVAVIIAGAVAGITLWALSTPGTPPPRARRYLQFKACLLTDSKGISGSAAAPLWQAMQKASLATRARVQYLPVAGPATAANATPYLNALIQRHCDIILATGTAQTAAVTAQAPLHPHSHFLIVGATAPQANITAIPSPAAASKIITDAVHAG